MTYDEAMEMMRNGASARRSTWRTSRRVQFAPDLTPKPFETDFTFIDGDEWGFYGPSEEDGQATDWEEWTPPEDE